MLGRLWRVFVSLALCSAESVLQNRRTEIEFKVFKSMIMIYDYNLRCFLVWLIKRAIYSDA
jgi:predicted nuclease of restriction endonuclease-like (RecB) superfamily